MDGCNFGIGIMTSMWVGGCDSSFLSFFASISFGSDDEEDGDEEEDDDEDDTEEEETEDDDEDDVEEDDDDEDDLVDSSSFLALPCDVSSFSGRAVAFDSILSC